MDSNNYMFEALQRRQKMMGKAQTPYDKMGTVTQEPSNRSIGGEGMGTNLDKGMNPAYAKKSVPSIKTK